ncbi:hypothetical protein [Lacipirellula sp.]|uniref:hypothetical protein n=1 Tax=Lacipirellula sp. TaxID=2691419 RepID=UPI003D1196C6
MSRVVSRELCDLAYEYRAIHLGADSGRRLRRVQSVNAETAIAIADIWEAATHSPNDSSVAAAYKQFAAECVLQWNFVIAAGIHLEPWPFEKQPYDSSGQMMDDVDANRHLYFFRTSNGFGDSTNVSADTSDHACHWPSGIISNGSDLCINDLFRAIHDIFGHVIGEFNFGPIGEENAWLCHSSMFSDSARRAMTSETRAQNSWVNFGPLRRNPAGRIIRKGESGYLPLQQRPFAQQKMTLLPDEFVFGP